jgi:electron transfer flavoprotein-quinone oxidoreductase
MQAQGPIIKGMNHAVSAGALAAEAFVQARSRGKRHRAGELYAKKLHDEGVMDKLRPTSYELTSAITESDAVSGLADSLVNSPLGKIGMKVADRAGLVEWGFNSPTVMAMMPDIKTSYVTLPEVLAEATGERVTDENHVQPPELDDRIGDLTYDTDVGNPHIEVLDNSWEASGTAVTACPVSAKDFGGGCYREETVQRNGSEEKVVSLDTQPCVECGTCAVIADTHWEHPRGGKGVEYKQG